MLTVMIKRGLGYLTLLAVLGCSKPESLLSRTQAPVQVQAAPVFPAAAWGRVEPGAAGFTQTGLDAVVAQARAMATTGLVVAVDGRVLLEYGDVEALSYLASVRKSVLAMLYGNHVASGKVDLGRTLAQLGLSDHGGLSAQEQEATIDDLLCARSGVYHPASNSGDNLDQAPPRGSQKHGAYFLYSNWDFNALGTIFEQETGRGIYDEVADVLAGPLQMQDFRREAQRKSGDLTRSMHPAYHMWFSTRDMARIGHLMLHQGNWNGRQVIPAEWARRITTLVTPSTEMNPEKERNGRFGYGRLWWIFDGPQAVGPYQGAYTGIGARGQYITVFPSLRLVVAHKVNVDAIKGSVTRDEYLALLDKILAARRPS